MLRKAPAKTASFKAERRHVDTLSGYAESPKVTGPRGDLREAVVVVGRYLFGIDGFRRGKGRGEQAVGSFDAVIAGLLILRGNFPQPPDDHGAIYKTDLDLGQIDARLAFKDCPRLGGRARRNGSKC